MRFWKRLVFIAAMAVGAPAAQAGSLQILTGGTSGVYYPVGLALQEIFERELPALDFKVLSTQATVENLNMLQRGEGLLALAQGDILAEAQAGNPEAGFPSSRTNIRLVGAAYPNFIHVIAHRDGRIDTFDDLAGKRVSVGPSRSGNELNARALLGAAGLSYADLLQVEFLHYGDSVDLFLKGELDAVIISAGLGVAAVHEASKGADIRIVPVDRAIVEVHSQMFFPIEIPAESYRGQDESVATAALNNFFVTTSEAPDDLVYGITKAIFENLAEIGEAHSAAAVISREAALAARPIEVHPGALRYFREHGLTD
ncbi:TAXI family TRAP transporter solute-binding subunit [Halomonas alkalisoli]|uniref:TAXI family TRAP transporter solute-binding subunit n=1 Tax=Halomonas alkalisoli TaxID=2907158 RepID=UPI001F36C82E|nr:TAXI family TRAP transporter solute-binding subunit [Halomonas alkalisoli]MCE9684327.1 TAXI family TRAP transporter solute-binding subunit [Halomonas alkalisoli]